MKKRRFGAQDIAKGIMITGVVFFHCYLMTFAQSSEALANFNVLFAIFPYLLAVFFFYAGYNYQPNGRSIGQSILRRLKQLIIPMVVAFVISAISISSMELIFAAATRADIKETFLAIGNSVLHGLMSDPLAKMIGFPHNGGEIYQLYLALSLNWFLYALFICSIFFYLLVGFTNKKLIRLISVVVGLLIIAFCLGQFVGVYLPYTVQCYPVILAIMLTAAYLRKSHFLNKRIKTKKAVFLHIINMIVAEGIVVGLCLVCHFEFGALLTGSLPGGMFDPVMKGFDAIIAFVFSIIGTYFIHTLCRLIAHIPVVGISLEWVGSHSAIFYLFHPIAIDFASIVIFQKQRMWGIGQAFFLVAITIIILTGVCFLIDLLLKKRKKVIEYKEEIRKSHEDEDLDDIITE